jgi:hypothetical protein
VVLAEEAGRSEGHVVMMWIGVLDLSYPKGELTSLVGRNAHAGAICRGVIANSNMGHVYNGQRKLQAAHGLRVGPYDCLST